MGIIVIISDDLTGAADTGIQFVHAGRDALVLLSDAIAPLPQADVLVGVTESRHDDPERARQKVRTWATLLARLQPDVVYKKIDSTLRGNLGAELEGCLEAFPGRLVVLAPAYPAAGRTTVNGRHCVRGIPLEQTEVARDPIAPVRESAIPRLVGRQTCRRIGQVRLQDLAADPEQLARTLRTQRAAGVEILVCDACTDDDLARLVAGVRRLDEPVIWAGSAGLARQLALCFGGGERAGSSLPRPGGPLLTIAGSVSESLRRQVAHYCRHTGAACIVADPDALAAAEPEAGAEVARVASEAAAMLRAGRSTVVTTRVQPERIAPGPQMAETARAVALRLGQIARRIYESGCFGRLVLSGGDTAMEVIRALEARALRLRSEPVPGVALGTLVGGPCEGLAVITKAGSFGGEDVLCQISQCDHPESSPR